MDDKEQGGGAIRRPRRPYNFDAGIVVSEVQLCSTLHDAGRVTRAAQTLRERALKNGVFNCATISSGCENHEGTFLFHFSYSSVF